MTGYDLTVRRLVDVCVHDDEAYDIEECIRPTYHAFYQATKILREAKIKHLPEAWVCADHCGGLSISWRNVKVGKRLAGDTVTAFVGYDESAPNSLLCRKLSSGIPGDMQVCDLDSQSLTEKLKELFDEEDDESNN